MEPSGCQGFSQDVSEATFLAELGRVARTRVQCIPGLLPDRFGNCHSAGGELEPVK